MTLVNNKPFWGEEGGRFMDRGDVEIIVRRDNNIDMSNNILLLKLKWAGWETKVRVRNVLGDGMGR